MIVNFFNNIESKTIYVLEILVDRGFTTEDLLMPRHVHLNIPPSLRGRDKLTPREELLTSKISKARIHIERYNERTKKFRVISGTTHLNMTPLARYGVNSSSSQFRFVNSNSNFSNPRLKKNLNPIHFNSLGWGGWVGVRFVINKTLKMVFSHLICTFCCDTSPGFLLTRHFGQPWTVGSLI